MKIAHFKERGGRFYWEPSPTLRKAGWKTQTLARESGDRPEALAEAERINDQVAAWRQAGGGRVRHSVAAAIEDWKASDDWQELAPKTQRTYGQALAIVARWYGSRPLRSVAAADFRRRHRDLARAAPATAAMVGRVVRILWKRMEAVPVTDGLSLSCKRAVEPRLWKRDELIALIAEADAIGRPSVGDAMAFGYWLGHYPVDLIALQRSNFRGGRFTFDRSKTGQPISVEANPLCLARIEAAFARQRQAGMVSPWLLICEATQCPYPAADALTKAFRRVREAAAYARPDLAELRFAWLRHTAIVRLAEAGCSIPEIAAISGHTLATVHDVLEHYLVRTDTMSTNATRKRLAFEGDDA